MEGPSRYLIGIDLGTTNCAVAYIDTSHGTSAPSPSGIRLFEIAQLTGPGEVRLAPLLPSLLYFATEDEVSSGSVNLPWDERPSAIAGIIARDQGALVQGRQVSVLVMPFLRSSIRTKWPIAHCSHLFSIFRATWIFRRVASACLGTRHRSLSLGNWLASAEPKVQEGFFYLPSRGFRTRLQIARHRFCHGRLRKRSANWLRWKSHRVTCSTSGLRGTRIGGRTQRTIAWRSRTFCSPCLPRSMRKHES